MSLTPGSLEKSYKKQKTYIVFRLLKLSTFAKITKLADLPVHVHNFHNQQQSHTHIYNWLLIVTKWGRWDQILNRHFNAQPTLRICLCLWGKPREWEKISFSAASFIFCSTAGGGVWGNQHTWAALGAKTLQVAEMVKMQQYNNKKTLNRNKKGKQFNF